MKPSINYSQGLSWHHVVGCCFQGSRQIGSGMKKRRPDIEPRLGAAKEDATPASGYMKGWTSTYRAFQQLADE